MPPHAAPRQALEAAARPFCRYRRPRQVWQEFQEWWGQEHPGKPLPGLHNLPELTGISLPTLYRLNAHSLSNERELD